MTDIKLSEKEERAFLAYATESPADRLFGAVYPWQSREHSGATWNSLVCKGLLEKTFAFHHSMRGATHVTEHFVLTLEGRIYLEKLIGREELLRRHHARLDANSKRS